MEAIVGGMLVNAGMSLLIVGTCSVKAVDGCGCDTECMWMNAGVSLLIVCEYWVDVAMNVWRKKK